MTSTETDQVRRARSEGADLTDKERAALFREIAERFDRLGAPKVAASNRASADRLDPPAPEFEDGVYTVEGHPGYFERKTRDDTVDWTGTAFDDYEEGDQDFVARYGTPTPVRVLAEGERVLAADEIAIPRAAVETQTADVWQDDANRSTTRAWTPLFAALADALDADGGDQS